MQELKATDEELQWLSKIPYIQPWFVDYVSNYRNDPSEVTIYGCDANLELSFEAPWRRTIHNQKRDLTNWKHYTSDMFCF